MHHSLEDIPDLRGRFPALDVREGVPWVDNGKVITSAGISAGIEMSLHLITRLAGKELAMRTAHQMEYHWGSAGLSKETI
jgi:transcriptional regulator GlxA family with amidase domain